MNKATVTIIGLGRTGKVLSQTLEEAGYQIYSTISKGEHVSKVGDITFITTPDSEIVKVSKQLLDQVEDIEHKYIFHCSGTVPSSVLKELEMKGAMVGCLHPLMAITETSKSFRDVYFDIEAPENSVSQIKKIIEDLGAKSFVVTEKEKELLHVSAVMASNYLVTLTDLALRISEKSNISQRILLDAMLPLMNSSLTNLRKLTPSKALTGPISRGDIQTVQKHIKLLEGDQEMLDMYKKLGLLTLELSGDNLEDNTIKFRLYDVLK